MRLLHYTNKHAVRDECVATIDWRKNRIFVGFFSHSDLGGYLTSKIHSYGWNKVPRGGNVCWESSQVTSSHLLRVVSPVEVVPRNAALRAGHVPADDEVRASEVLTDHHVLHRLFVGGQ